MENNALSEAMLPGNLLNKPKLVKGIKKQYLGVWYPQFQKKKKKKQNKKHVLWVLI